MPNRAAAATLSGVRRGRLPGWVKVAASITLAAGLFAYFLWRAPLADVGRELARVHIGWVSLAVVLALASYGLRALRWGVILRPAGTAPVGPLMGCTAAGFATSSILPARAGEVVRPLLLSARTGLPAAATLASILTERLLDGASVLVYFILGVLIAGRRFDQATLVLLHRAVIVACVGLVSSILFVWLLLRRRDGAISLLTRPVPERFKARVASFLHHVLDGLQVLGTPTRLLEVAGWSLGMWLVIGSQLVVLANAFPDVKLGLWEAFVVITVSVVGLAVPTPAGVGGFHTAIQLALTHLAGVALGPATAYALIHHAICFFPITVLGLIYMGSVGLSLGRAGAMHEPAPTTGEP